VMDGKRLAWIVDVARDPGETGFLQRSGATLIKTTKTAGFCCKFSCPMTPKSPSFHIACR